MSDDSTSPADIQPPAAAVAPPDAVANDATAPDTPVEATPAPAEGSGADPSALPERIAVFGSEALRNRLEHSVPGQPLTALKSLPDLLSHWTDEDLRSAIVEVPADGAWMLPVLSGLLALPQCAAKPLVIVLDEPTSDLVVECGRAGLFRVLPLEFDDEALKTRLA